MDTLPELPVVMAFQHFNDYITCPKRFNHRYITCDCPKEIKSGQQTGGIATHDAIKRRLKLREPLPDELQQHEATCAALLAGKEESQRYVEHPLGCTAEGKPCGFFDAVCRLRGRLDLCFVRPDVAVIIDWKTGKTWEDPLELQIQGLLLKIHHPEVKQINAFYWWLRTSKPGITYTLDPVKTWNNVTRYMQSIRFRIDSNDWPADENPLCPWCPVGKDQCEFKKDPPK